MHTDTRDLRSLLVVTHDRHSLVQLIDRFDLLWCQLDFTALDQIIELFDTGRSDDRSTDKRLGYTPSQRDLGHGNSFGFCDFFDLVDDGDAAIGLFAL